MDKPQLSLRAPFNPEVTTTPSASEGPVARFQLAGSFEAQGVARVQKYKSPKVNSAGPPSDNTCHICHVLINNHYVPHFSRRHL